MWSSMKPQVTYVLVQPVYYCRFCLKSQTPTATDPLQKWAFTNWNLTFEAFESNNLVAAWYSILSCPTEWWRVKKRCRQTLTGIVDKGNPRETNKNYSVITTWEVLAGQLINKARECSANEQTIVSTKQTMSSTKDRNARLNVHHYLLFRCQPGGLKLIRNHHRLKSSFCDVSVTFCPP
jgi:hypothetical protein